MEIGLALLFSLLSKKWIKITKSDEYSISVAMKSENGGEYEWIGWVVVREREGTCVLKSINSDYALIEVPHSDTCIESKVCPIQSHTIIMASNCSIWFMSFLLLPIYKIWVVLYIYLFNYL
jgi:hypothetical protein